MKIYFHQIEHDHGTDYLKTNLNAELTAKTLGCPLSAIIKTVEIYKNEAHLPASSIATSAGLLKILMAPMKTPYGAPMGRDNKIIDNPGRLFDRALPMSSCGAYDKGGAYWGTGRQMRVQFNGDLTYVRYYRKGR